MKRFLAVLLLLLAVGLAWNYYPPARLSAYVLLGRNQGCPMARAVKSDDDLKRQILYKDEILAASKLLQKDEKGFELWRTPLGTYWVPDGSRYVLPFNLAEQKRDIYDAANSLHAGDIVLDCGANIGVFTKRALEAGAAKVVAIEPGPENIECLRRNFAKEIESGKVILYPKGVWDKDDFLTLNVDPNNSAADSFVIQREGAQAVQKIPLTTIDKMVAELNLDHVDFIKMDIEGSEPKALAGGKQTIAKYKPRMSISAYHAPDHPESIPRAVKDAFAGYQTECGPCAETQWAVRPDILYFHP
jgi:FkbM family methyltransferase